MGPSLSNCFDFSMFVEKYVPRQQTRTFVEAIEQYAPLGLWTLCLAWRELNEDEYREWSLIFKDANSTLVDREVRVAEACQRLEHDLEIRGVAAIEDRLQHHNLLLSTKENTQNAYQLWFTASSSSASKMNFRRKTTLLIIFVTFITILCQVGVQATRVLPKDFADENYLETYPLMYEKAKLTMTSWLERLSSGPSPKGP
ncbi:hypothetical protein U1Q18_031430, partial [Sarracenia purpurea var. burkii]